MRKTILILLTEMVALIASFHLSSHKEDTIVQDAEIVSRADSTANEARFEAMFFEINDYDPSWVSEVNRCYDEQSEKYGNMLPNDYTNIPRESTYGIMTEIDNLMVSHMKYINDEDWKPDVYTDENGKKVVTLDHLAMQNAVIVFEDGTPAFENDILPGTSLLVNYTVKDEIFPGVIYCDKIVIMT